MGLLTRHVPAVQEALWTHPEWWVVTLGLLAWGLVLQQGIAPAGHAQHLQQSVGVEFVSWHVMVLAMMVPTMAWTARAIAVRSLADRRHRAMAAFLVGYLVPWSALGIVAVWASDLSWSHSRWAIAGTFALATVWTLLPMRERAMVRWSGYAPVVAPTGWPAVRDCTRAGLIVGAWCVVSCWALMLACAFSGHHPGALAAGGTIGVAEIRSFRPPRRFVFLVSVVLTTFFWMR